MSDQLIIDFERTMVAGNRNAALKAIDAGRRDLPMVAVADIHVMPGYNVRSNNAKNAAHIRALADSMKREGYYPASCLEGVVLREGGKDVVYLTGGHCRLAAVEIAISEGAVIERLPMVFAPPGTSQEDLTVAMAKGNSGKPIEPYEMGLLCKRLSRLNCDVQTIAERMNLGVAYVEGLLLLVSAPANIRDMVIHETVSATVAITALKTHGDGAYAALQSALQSSGGQRVTNKYMPGSVLKKAVKKAAPQMLGVLEAIKADPAFASIDQGLREKIEELMKGVDAAKAVEAERAAGAGATDEAGAETTSAEAGAGAKSAVPPVNETVAQVVASAAKEAAREAAEAST